MNVFEASNLPYLSHAALLRHLSDADLIYQYECFDRIRAMSSDQATIDRAIQRMNLIHAESNRREYASWEK